DAPAGGTRQRLPARPGDPPRAVRLRDRREPAHGPPQLRPRPAVAHQLMSQLDPTVFELPAATTPLPRRSKLHVPGWLLLLLGNPKSRAGLLNGAFIVLIAPIAPLLAADAQNASDLTP